MPSFDRPIDSDIAPSAWVTRLAGLIRPGGLVLDLACGHGRHARWFASRGFHVVAADLEKGLRRAFGEGAKAGPATSDQADDLPNGH